MLGRCYRGGDAHFGSWTVFIQWVNLSPKTANQEHSVAEPQGEGERSIADPHVSELKPARPQAFFT
jgi:hypothetical protein